MDFTLRLLDLITENESIEELMHEVTDGRSANQLKVLSDPSFIGLKSLVNNHCKLTGTSFSSATANILCSVIKSSFAKTEQKLFLENSEEREKLHNITDIGKNFVDLNQFSSREFAKKLNKKDETCIPFEVIWMLHKSSLMTLDLFFLCNLEYPEMINSMARYAGQMCCKDDEHNIELRKLMLYDMLSCLLEIAFAENASDVISKGLKKVCLALLDNIIKKLLSLKEKEQDVNMFAVLNARHLKREMLGKFYLRQACIVMTKKSDEVFSFELFSSHLNWTYVSMNKNLRNIFEELLVLINIEEMFDAMRKLLEQQEFDWMNGLMFVSVLLVCFPTFISLVEGLAITILQRSLQVQNMEELASAVLIIRHCCVQGCHVYMPYNLWFKKTIRDESFLTSNKKYFSFFLKLLTNLLPHETEDIIKAHIQNPPVTTSKSREEWFEYVTLAKTRLSDIRLDIDPVAMEVENQELINKAEREVNLALESFQKDSKIPAFIIEMSLFSRSYFIGKFLPVLLKPRLLPGVADERMLLISALTKSSKIPVAMFQAYESECQRMASELMEGVIVMEGGDDYEDEMQALQLPLLEQLKVSFKTLKNHVVVDFSSNLTRCLSDASEKLFAISKKSSNPLDEGNRVIDLAHYHLGDGEMCQAAHTILEFILETTLQEMQNARPICSGWLDKLILMLSSHPEVTAHMYRTAGNLIACQSDHLSDCHFIGLANLILHRLQLNNETHPTVKFDGKNFLSYVEDLVRFTDIVHLQKVVVFISSYVVIARTKYGTLVTSPDEFQSGMGLRGFIPGEFVDLLNFALPRLNPPLRSCNAGDVDKFIGKVSMECIKIALKMIYQEKLEIFNRSISFKKWIKYEMNTTGSDENLSLLNDYYMWVIHSGRHGLSSDHGIERTDLERYCMEVFESLCHLDLQASIKCSECLAHVKVEKESKHLCFVYLIQNLANKIFINHDCLPWMWEAVDWTIQNFVGERTGFPQKDRTKFSELLVCSKIVRLMTKLPPFLLLSNSPTFSATTSTISRGLSCMASFINSSMRNATCSGILMLDLDLTLHLLHALSMMPSGSASSELEPFFTSTPLLCFSILHHWNDIRSTEVYGDEVRPLRGVLDKMTSDIDRCPSRRTSAASFLGLDSRYFEVFDACAELASCIFDSVRNTTNNNSNNNHGRSNNNGNSFESIASAVEKRLLLFSDLRRFIDGDEYRRILRPALPDFVDRLWSSAMLSVFCRLSKRAGFLPSSLSASSFHAPFLDALLECYREFNEFFENPDVDQLVLYSEPFVDVTSAAETVIGFLESVPPACLRSIDGEVLNRSDFYIRAVVNEFARR